MAGKRWSKAEDAIIKERHADLTAVEIAALLPGRTKRAVDHRREALGLPPRPGKEVGALGTTRWRARLEASIGEPIGTWLKRRYVEEKASYRDITAELGINTRSLMKLMRLYGIEPISGSEAVRRQIEKDPTFLEKMIERGTSHAAAINRARTRQANWRTFCTPPELAFLDALNEAGLTPIPQLAVESYNIDFAFPSAWLAVEYDPRWHNTKARNKRDAKRDARLSELGWTVLRLESRASKEFNVNKVSDALRSAASTHPR